MPQRIEHKNAKFEFGYWPIRGLAQPIRLLLAYADVPYTEVRYGLNDDGTKSADRAADWSTHKMSLGLDFPNLPYLVDTSPAHEVRITQSNSIIRYLGRRFGLYGESESERVMIDVLQDEAYDLRNAIVDTAYTAKAGYKDALHALTEIALPRHLGGFESYLHKRGVTTHFVGEQLTFVDFILYELAWQASVMVPGSVTADHNANLFAFITQFEKLDAIATYMASSAYIDRPINGESASFK
jgi:glutathione S-transferase